MPASTELFHIPEGVDFTNPHCPADLLDSLMVPDNRVGPNQLKPGQSVLAWGWQVPVQQRTDGSYYGKTGNITLFFEFSPAKQCWICSSWARSNSVSTETGQA